MRFLMDSDGARGLEGGPKIVKRNEEMDKRPKKGGGLKKISHLAVDQTDRAFFGKKLVKRRFPVTESLKFPFLTFFPVAESLEIPFASLFLVGRSGFFKEYPGF